MFYTARYELVFFKVQRGYRIELEFSAMSAHYSSESHTSDYKRDERQEMLIAPPLDLSFRKASTMDGT